MFNKVIVELGTAEFVHIGRITPDYVQCVHVHVRGCGGKWKCEGFVILTSSSDFTINIAFTQIAYQALLIHFEIA